MLKVPSGFLYQPSNAGVTLWPESCFGSRGSCACTRTRVGTSANSVRMSARATFLPILVAGALGGRCAVCLVLCKPILIVQLCYGGHIDPCVCHFVDREV